MTAPGGLRPRLRIQLLVHVHTPGLRKDMAIIRHVLEEAGHQVTATGFDPAPHRRLRRGIHKVAVLSRLRPRYDVNIFVEDVSPPWFPTARRNLFIPNQEWLNDSARASLAAIDACVCKTEHATGVFAALGHPSYFAGFTSPDLFDPGVRREDGTCFHLAGSSMAKGTKLLHALWSRHPDWPSLHIAYHYPDLHLSPLPNVTLLRGYLPDERIRELMNMHPVHLHPTEAEGFGHAVVEAMACRNVVLTTDAPPMNEIVTPDRGVLVRYASRQPMGSDWKYVVDEEHLERQVCTLLSLDAAGRAALADRAQQWYIDNDRAFRRRFPEIIERCLDGLAPSGGPVT